METFVLKNNVNNSSFKKGWVMCGCDLSQKKLKHPKAGQVLMRYLCWGHILTDSYGVQRNCCPHPAQVP